MLKSGRGSPEEWKGLIFVPGIIFYLKYFHIKYFYLKYFDIKYFYLKFCYINFIHIKCNAFTHSVYPGVIVYF